MRESTIARNYAEALFTIGEHDGDTERYADLMAGLAAAIAAEPRIRVTLESPRVPKPVKQQLLERAMARHAPAPFIRFLAAVVKRGRQGMLPAIADQYGALVDDKFNRVHAGITLAREPDDRLKAAVQERLSAVFGKQVLPHFRTDPSILGGLIVRVGDRIMDGSLRRKMMALKRQMLEGRGG